MASYSLENNPLQRIFPTGSVFSLLTVLFLALLLLKANAQADDKARTVRQVLLNYHVQGHFDGVALIAQNGHVLYADGFGQADRERQVPNTPDTPYRLCSITKQFTALLVMQLVQQGRLRLGGVVTDYLPDFRHDTGSRITVENLLTHTSGLAQLDSVLPDDGFYSKRAARFASPAYVIKRFLSGELTRPPGQKFEYNNADYIVLSAILERVTGRPYDRLFQERIFRPLGMRHTGFITRDRFSARQAQGYVQQKSRLAPEPYIHVANFGASGAMYSTASDLLLWDRALDTNRLLTKKYQDIMFTPRPTLGYEALSSWVYHASLPGIKTGPRLIERDGAIGAFNTLNLRAPDDGYSIILLSNTDAADIGQIYAQKGLAYDIVRALYSAPKKEN